MKRGFHSTTRSTKFWTTIPALIAGFCLGGGVVGWAVSSVLSPATDLDQVSFTYVEVAEGSVGSSMDLSSTVSWEPINVGVNWATGTVTNVVIEPGAQVSQGSIVYTVDLRPVVVAAGDVPMFRELSAGTSGDDVRQLQQMLYVTGFRSKNPDGVFDASTDASVRNWQSSMKVEATGVVGKEDVIFVPTLPLRVMLDSDLVYRGAVLVGGEQVLKGFTNDPVFAVNGTQMQALALTPGTRVMVTPPEGTAPWIGFIRESHPDPDTGGVKAVVQGKDANTLCAAACDVIPPGETILPAEVIVVEKVTGLVVPTAAVLSKPDGSGEVIDRSGVSHQVKVGPGALGMSIIEGVEAGLEVRIPAIEETPE